MPKKGETAESVEVVNAEAAKPASAARWVAVNFTGRLYLAGHKATFETASGPKTIEASREQPILEGEFGLPLPDGRVVAVGLKAGQRVLNKLAREMMDEITTAALGALGTQ